MVHRAVSVDREVGQRKPSYSPRFIMSWIWSTRNEAGWTPTSI